MNYASHLKATQRERERADQISNNAGGFVFAVDDWTRLDRFLILGTDGGTYYATERAITRDNAACVERCIASDGVRTVARIVEISDAGRAAKNGPALLALAMSAKLGNVPTRKAAWDALPSVARTGSHLFELAGYVQAFGGWGRATKRAFRLWYNDKDSATLVYQAIKYQQREGWSHRDLLRLSKPTPATPAHSEIYHWIAKGVAPSADSPSLAQLDAFIRIQEAGTPPKEVCRLITEHHLPRECVPTEALARGATWEALLPHMPMTAMLRNLPTMTRLGVLAPMSEALATVTRRLSDGEALTTARIHPLSVLGALVTYQGGGAIGRSQHTWTPVPQVVDALDAAFYAAFGAVEPTRKRTMLSLDVSASMNSGSLGGYPGVSPRIGSAAMALITAAVEPQRLICGFSDAFMDLAISARERLDDVVAYMNGLPFGRTDCALPMLAAQASKIPVDVFVIYTDNETWCGNVHPYRALRDYRQATGIAAKLVVVGMTATNFTIADPSDAGMLDIVGFDTATPALLSDFAIH